MDVFNALARFRVKERMSLSSVYCTLSPPRFYSSSFHSVETLVLVSIVLRYTNIHHHPYIDSTTVLSDTLFPGGAPLSHGVLLGTPGQLLLNASCSYDLLELKLWSIKLKLHLQERCLQEVGA